MTDELKTFLEDEGYTHIREVEGKGVCGLYKFLFTFGLVYGIDSMGYRGRYCFDSPLDAAASLTKWSGQGDPDGNWIKHKGDKEYDNPNRKLREGLNALD